MWNPFKKKRPQEGDVIIITNRGDAHEGLACVVLESWKEGYMLCALNPTTLAVDILIFFGDADRIEWKHRSKLKEYDAFKKYILKNTPHEWPHSYEEMIKLKESGVGGMVPMPGANAGLIDSILKKAEDRGAELAEKSDAASIPIVFPAKAGSDEIN